MVRAIAHDSDIDSCGLSYSEIQELWLGACNSSVFNSPEELRDAWARGRDVVMRLWARGGRRPQGWWAFEAGDLRYPGYSRERSVLWRANVLTADERAELEAAWAQAFDAARGMSAQERREHLAHHDVPHELVKLWGTRRSRAGNRTETAAPGGAGPLNAEARK
jgi:hypothetical protein